MASFAEVLRGYLETIGCSAKELADATGISPSGISRYLAGNRVPPKNSATAQRLAAGIAELADMRGISALDEDEVLTALVESLGGPGTDIPLFSSKLHQLIEMLGISHNALARSTNFDPSYISRIAAGQRHPKDPEGFARAVAAYISRNHNDPAGTAAVAELTGIDQEDLADRQALENAVRDYLLRGMSQPIAPAISGFLDNLDRFDLGDYLKSVDLGSLQAPPPSAIPTFSERTYHGTAGGMQAELDFLMLAASSEDTGEIVLYSDFPIARIAQEDASYAGKIMAGMAALLKKGCSLRNIHNLHRPLTEVIMGLEGWLPIYMTGQMTPYYLPYPTNHTFLHFLRAAPGVCMSGEGVAGCADDARYTVSRNAEYVAYLQQRAKDLLDHAKPLFHIFFEKDAAKCEEVIDRLAANATAEPMEVGSETFQNMTLTVWPGSHAVVRKLNAPPVTMVIEYLPLVDAMAHYEPQLFASH